MPQLAAANAGIIAGPQNAERCRTAASTRAVADQVWRTTACALTVADAFVLDDAVRAAARGTFARNFVVFECCVMNPWEQSGVPITVHERSGRPGWHSNGAVRLLA